MSDARARILARIEAAAAGRSAARTSVAGDPVQPALQGELLDTFETAAVAADTEVVRLHGVNDIPDAVAGRIEGIGAVGIADVPALTGLNWDAADVATRVGTQATAFVVEAFAGVAETGTVVLVSDDALTASTFLADHLFVVLSRASVTAWQETVWRRLEERYGQAMPRGIILMTGPSRTGDVEQTLQLGAHGPRTLSILLT